jgi:hypothetical protein
VAEEDLAAPLEVVLEVAVASAVVLAAAVSLVAVLAEAGRIQQSVLIMKLSETVFCKFKQNSPFNVITKNQICT